MYKLAILCVKYQVFYSGCESPIDDISLSIQLLLRALHTQLLLDKLSKLLSQNLLPPFPFLLL